MSFSANLNPSSVAHIIASRSSPIGVASSASSRHHDCALPRPTRPRNWCNWANPKLSAPSIIITAIQISDQASPQATVAWSRKLVGTTYSADAKVGDPVTVPATLNIRNTFLIRVESDLGYTPVIMWDKNNKDQKALGLLSTFSDINMSETYYLRPRRSPTIPCSDC